MKTAIEMLRNDTAVWRGDPPSVAAAILQRSTRFTEKENPNLNYSRNLQPLNQSFSYAWQMLTTVVKSSQRSKLIIKIETVRV